MRSIRCLEIAVIVLGLASLMDAAPKRPGSQSAAQKRDEQRENEAVRKAQDHLKDVEKEAKNAEDELRDAQQRVRQAVSQRQSAAAALQKTIERLESEHADLTGLTAARREFKAAQAAFDNQAAPVRKALQSQAEFQAAQQTLARVKEKMKSADKDAVVDRAQLAREFATATADLRELEQAAFRREANLIALQTNIDQSQSRVQQAVDKFEKAVERDRDLKAARATFDNAKTAEDRAEQAVTKAAREVTSLRAKIAQATQQLQQKKLQDQRDDNRGKNRGKN
ncbi:MAG TPA: hypothetical protein VFG20_10635 [Planctomycetaceae bacterium]|nr:hypothetical protein [Planctomycetaceae bacterium]